MSEKLSSAAFEKARAFLLTHSRPLERRLFQFHFENGSSEAVLDELARFQNPDGGFGHGLEADVRTPVSSAIATSIAFQVLREVEAPASHGLVERGMAYLLASFEAERQVWPQVPPAVNDAPHAPWWHWNEKALEPGRFLANPRAELVGYFYDYRQHVPEEFRERLTAAVITELEGAAIPLEMHDLLCYIRFADTKTLLESARERALVKLREAVSAQVGGPESWAGYGLKPLDVAPSPDSVFYAIVKPWPEQQLEREIPQQGEDGAWTPPWSWSEAYPEAWAQAEREWKGVLTLKMLLAARNYGVL